MYGQLAAFKRGVTRRRRTKPNGDRFDVVVALRELREFDDSVGVDIGANEGDVGRGDEEGRHKPVLGAEAGAHHKPKRTQPWRRREYAQVLEPPCKEQLANEGGEARQGKIGGDRPSLNEQELLVTPVGDGVLSKMSV